jgi:prepilin-type N-terminal cleavage/methylation domain-containing protein
MYAQHNNTPDKAFTLSELLISLSVLGLIAALTLPSVFNSVNDRKKNALLKETITSLADATAAESADTAAPQNTLTFLQKELNVQNCSNTLTVTSPTDANDVNGCILQNGVYILHADLTNTTADSLLLDWNGNAAPNTLGNDRIVVWVNWASVPATTVGGASVPTNLGVAQLRPGEVLPRTADRTAFEALYN